MDDQFSKKSTKSTLRDEEVENLIVVPPDGGWGWIIVAAAFCSNVVADGIMFTFGIFLEDLSKSFNVTVGHVTMVGSITTCFYYLVGPFVSALLNKYGFRFVAITGCLMSATGFAVGSVCYNFPLFVTVTGVLIGMGFGMITIPAVIVVGFYFEKWRALATGIATCGSGIGTLLTPPFLTFLLDRLGWRNTYRVLACIILSTILLAILYRPLQPIRAVQDEKEIQIIQQTDSIGSIEIETTQCCKCSSWKHHNISYPTTADVVPIETVILENLERSEDSSTFSYTTFENSNIGTTNPSITQNTTTQLGNTESRVLFKVKKCAKCRIIWQKFLKIICCGHIQTTSRPMYRDDIFFGHSLMLLPQYKNSIATQHRRLKLRKSIEPMSRGIPPTQSTGYHMSVTRVTTHREIYGRSVEQKCMCCPLAMLRTLATMLDLRLLKSPAFQIFSCSGMFIVFGYMVPYLYIKDRAITHGISPHVAFWLISAIGAANTVGRIISGILPSLTNLKVIQYSCTSISIAGIMTLVSGFNMTTEFQFFYACVFGMAASCIATLRPVIVVELFGLEHLTNAFGLQLMFMGIAAFTGTMVAGIVYDATNDYNVAFYISGSCFVISSLLLSVLNKIRIYEKKHNCAGGL